MTFSLQRFVRAYLAAAHWLETGEEGQPAKSREFSEGAKDAATRTCAMFYTVARCELEKAITLPGYDEDLAGVDLWLTQNGHGAGFFDRKVLVDNEIGERLTELVRQNVPPVSVYEGNDGMLHIA